jgi:hypothetical protein
LSQIFHKRYVHGNPKRDLKCINTEDEKLELEWKAEMTFELTCGVEEPEDICWKDICELFNITRKVEK